MKNPIFLIILLALGLAFTSYKWISTASAEPGEIAPASTTISDIMTRTSVRSYSDRKVGQEQLDTLLRAAMAAPTAGNKQPWRFVVIDDRATLSFFTDTLKNMSMAKDAALAVVMCGDLDAAYPGVERDYWIQDVSAASENLLLAAHAMGLGAVWCGVYPVPERVELFSKLLRLPSDIVPMACICIGYPEGTPVPKDKWHPEYIHYNTWTSSKP